MFEGPAALVSLLKSALSQNPDFAKNGKIEIDEYTGYADASRVIRISCFGRKNTAIVIFNDFAHEPFTVVLSRHEKKGWFRKKWIDMGSHTNFSVAEEAVKLIQRFFSSPDTGGAIFTVHMPE